MKKSLLVLALAGAMAAPAVMAQSSVTIYGRLNLSVERISADGAPTVTNFVDNASRLGFKGVEDLGGGLKAGFQIEHGFDVQNGVADSTFWGRQSEVFLGGSFGTLRLGSFISEAYFATADYISMHNHDTGTSSDVFYYDVRGFGQSNKVGYISPDLGGLVVHAAVNAGQDSGEERTFELAAFYDAGPLHLGAGFQKRDDTTQFALRGLYELGAFTLGAYYQNVSDAPLAGDRDSWRLSGMYTMGASEFHLNYGQADDFSNVANSDVVQWTAAYNYNLSKRTKVYVFYSQIAKDSNPTLVNNSSFYGGNREYVAAGIRHNF